MKVLGVCGGNGVLLYPFRDILIGNIEPRSVFHTTKDKQWKLNFNINLDKTNKVRFSKGNVDIILGAPDCGHSSNLAYSRGKKLKDPRENKSLQIFIESVNYYQPDIFLMENLPKMLDSFGDLKLVFPNYSFKVIVDSVSVFGNSQQSRVRLVLIGCKDTDLLDNFNPFAVNSIKTSKELIDDLEFKKHKEQLCHVRDPDDMQVPLYWGEERKITLAKARNVWNKVIPKTSSKWPVNSGNLRNQPGVYRNLADNPPFTVRKSNRQFNHNGYQLTPREIARIQGIPDYFKLWYDLDNHMYSINKARTTCAKSPPYEVGEWFYKCLKKI